MDQRWSPGNGLGSVYLLLMVRFQRAREFACQQRMPHQIIHLDFSSLLIEPDVMNIVVRIPDFYKSGFVFRMLSA